MESSPSKKDVKRVSHEDLNVHAQEGRLELDPNLGLWLGVQLIGV